MAAGGGTSAGPGGPSTTGGMCSASCRVWKLWLWLLVESMVFSDCLCLASRFPLSWEVSSTAVNANASFLLCVCLVIQAVARSEVRWLLVALSIEMDR